MQQINTLAAPVGRSLIAAIFIISGIGKISAYAGTQAYMEAMGVPGARSPVEPRHVAPVLLDVELPADGRLVEPVPATHNALLWVLEGEVTIAGEREPQSVSAGQLGVFGEGDQVTVAAGRAAARFLLAHAARIGEPVARGGPFVMNTKDEIRQAFADYESGALGGDYYIPGARKTQE